MTSEVIRLLLVDDKVELRQNIRRLLSFEDSIEIVGEASNGQEAIESCRSTRPALVLMDINMPVMDGIQATEIISMEMPEITIIMMSVQGEQEYIRKAMKAGARDFLVKPFSNDDLIDTIKSVFKANQRRSHLAAPPPVPQPPQPAAPAPAPPPVPQAVPQAVPAPPQPAAPYPPQPPPQSGVPAPPPAAPAPPPQAAPVQPAAPMGPAQGEIITMFSTKGGVGKTTIALNLAITVKRLTGRRVCVVDSDLQFGDAAIMLNLQPQKTLHNLAEEPPPWTADLVSEYITHHEPSGIDVLLAPAKPEYAETVQVEHIEEALRLLKERYDYIFVDTSPFFRNVELSVLDLSTLIFVVVTLELSAIKSIKLCLELLNSLNYPEDKIRLVLNRGYPPMGGIEVNDVQNGLRKEVVSLIPSAGKEVVSALNKGTPFMIQDGNSDLVKAFNKLAELVAPTQGAGDKGQAGGGGVFGRLFGAK